MRRFRCDNCRAEGEAPHYILPKGWDSRAYWLSPGNLFVYFCSTACLQNWEHNHIVR